MLWLWLWGKFYLKGVNDVQDTWIARLRRWIRKLFSKPRRSSAPTILKRWYGTNCAVLRIARNTPGGIATYRIMPLRGDYDFLLTLDYLPELQAELVGEYNGTPFHLRHLYNPHNPGLTHRFAVWRIWRNGSSDAIGIWDCDLQGFTSSFALRELAPKRAVAGVALRSLQIIHSTKSPDMSWQSQMERMDWLGLLGDRIRGELSNPNHNLRACAILPRS